MLSLTACNANFDPAGGVLIFSPLASADMNRDSFDDEASVAISKLSLSRLCLLCYCCYFVIISSLTILPKMVEDCLDVRSFSSPLSPPGKLFNGVIDSENRCVTDSRQKIHTPGRKEDSALRSPMTGLTKRMR